MCNQADIQGFLPAQGVVILFKFHKDRAIVVEFHQEPIFALVNIFMRHLLVEGPLLMVVQSWSSKLKKAKELKHTEHVQV